MPLHLEDATLDKTRSHYMAETGKLMQLMRGIYVDADDDIDATVIKHAFRMLTISTLRLTSPLPVRSR